MSRTLRMNSHTLRTNRVWLTHAAGYAEYKNPRKVFSISKGYTDPNAKLEPITDKGLFQQQQDQLTENYCLTTLLTILLHPCRKKSNSLHEDVNNMW